MTYVAMHLIHDLRIVLLVLARTLLSLRREPQSEPMARDLDGLTRLVVAGMGIADDLLVTCDARPAVEPIDVNDVIGSLCDVIHAILGPAVRVETLLSTKASRVYARQVDLDRILLNVVLNAAAAMPSGGVLVIETSQLPPRADTRYPDAPFGRLKLTIGDTGPGMPIRDVWQVRDSTQQPRPDGTGIGLSSVALILLRLGGQLEIGGREDAGTVVEITLPLAPPPDERIH
jgi:signal transduction histidine kinase